MPAKCVAVGCQNTYAAAGISFHAFPKSAKLRKLWVIAARREKWEPSSHSVLCSAHFQDDDFVHDRSIFDQLPVKMKRLLKPGVVPTIFSHRKPASGKPRPAFEKRRRQEIVRNALASAEAVRVSDGHCMPSTTAGALDAYQAGDRTLSPMTNAELRRCVTHDHNYWKKSRNIASQTDEMLDTRALSKGVQIEFHKELASTGTQCCF